MWDEEVDRGRMFRAILGAALGIGLFCAMQWAVGQAMETQGLEYPAYYSAYKFTCDFSFIGTDPRTLRFILLSPGYIIGASALFLFCCPVYGVISLIALIVLVDWDRPTATRLILGGLFLGGGGYLDFYHTHGYFLSCLPYALAGWYLANTRHKVEKCFFLSILAVLLYLLSSFFAAFMLMLGMDC